MDCCTKKIWHRFKKVEEKINCRLMAKILSICNGHKAKERENIGKENIIGKV